MDSMDSLQVKAYQTGFNNLSYETQEKLLENLLKSSIGEKILYQREVSKMMIWFTNPIVRNLIQRCPIAEKFFLTQFEYNSAWENINCNLPTWFNRSHVITYVSEDKKIVFITPRNNTTLYPKNIDGKEVKQDNDYDLKLITETDFDLNNLYLGYNLVEKWWQYCIQLA